jgi:hypothetical protein
MDKNGLQCGQAVECLSSKPKALSSNPSTTLKKKERIKLCWWNGSSDRVPAYQVQVSEFNPPEPQKLTINK